ncbi:MAG: indole-3-glycerol phosphate synthase TrpC [Nitrospirota bacterium]
MNLLEKVIEAKRETVSSQKGRNALKELHSRIADCQPTRPFQKAISKTTGGRFSDAPHLIAEIKKGSPSRGILRENFDPIEIAKIYQGEGASALSILTEENFFFGKLSYLNLVRDIVSLPILQKDFILDEFQIVQARAFGADAILLIIALLDPQQAIDYFHLASGLTMDVLVEVHTKEELESILNWAPMIGINNRDLRTFQTNIQSTAHLIKEVSSSIQKGKVWVSESGIHARRDVAFLNEVGVDAMLIGEAFMVSDSIPQKMREMFGAAHGRTLRAADVTQ